MATEVPKLKPRKLFLETKDTNDSSTEFTEMLDVPAIQWKLG